MKISQEQFNSEIAKFKDYKLDADAKNRIKSRLLEHINTHVPPPVRSPYFGSFSFAAVLRSGHFSYKIAGSVAVMVLLVSIGTTYASQNSLPGDILYSIKTTVAEPILKLTKTTLKEKEDFDLSLADARIQEVEELIKQNKVTEKNITENFSLFEKHLEESKKDREQPKPTFAKTEVEMKSKTTASLSVELRTPEDPANQESKDKVKARVEKYRNLIKSKPDLKNFYENQVDRRLPPSEDVILNLGNTSGTEVEIESPINKHKVKQEDSEDKDHKPESPEPVTGAEIKSHTETKITLPTLTTPVLPVVVPQLPTNTPVSNPSPVNNVPVTIPLGGL